MNKLQKAVHDALQRYIVAPSGTAEEAVAYRHFMKLAKQLLSEAGHK